MWLKAVKSLLDIQQDVRNLENKVQEITESIKNISLDIDSIRNSSGGAVLDFGKIEVLAKQMEFGKHPLDRLKEGHICQLYIEILLGIVHLDSAEDLTIKRMVFIQWLQIQARIDWSLEDLYQDSFKIDKPAYYEMAELIPKRYKEYLLVDALMVANISGKANEEIYNYVADIVTILGIQSESVGVLASIAKLALSQSVEGIGREYLEKIYDKGALYSYYISGDLVEECKKALRVIEVEQPDYGVHSFKWKVQQQQKVRCGEVIATYLKEKQSRGYSFMREYKTEEIKATVSGTLFQFRNNNTNYGIIAHEQDNRDSIKAWVKSRR